MRFLSPVTKKRRTRHRSRSQLSPQHQSRRPSTLPIVRLTTAGVERPCVCVYADRHVPRLGGAQRRHERMRATKRLREICCPTPHPPRRGDGTVDALPPSPTPQVQLSSYRVAKNFTVECVADAFSPREFQRALPITNVNTPALRIHFPPRFLFFSTASFGRYANGGTHELWGAVTMPNRDPASCRFSCHPPAPSPCAPTIRGCSRKLPLRLDLRRRRSSFARCRLALDTAAVSTLAATTHKRHMAGTLQPHSHPDKKDSSHDISTLRCTSNRVKFLLTSESALVALPSAGVT